MSAGHKRVLLALLAVASTALTAYVLPLGIRENSAAIQLLGIVIEAVAAVSVTLTLINPWKDRG